MAPPWYFEVSLTDADQPLHRLNQLLRVVPDAVLEDDLHLLDVADVRRRVPLDDHQVGLLADGNRTHPRVFAEKLRAVEAGNPDRLRRREARLDQKLDPAQIAEAGDD